MGVIYKLKSEVIQFIVDQKKVDPKVSCRKMVRLVGEKFDVKISKSSANAVMKGAHLSNPVGRLPGSDIKPPKFKIPKERKEGLFAKTPMEALGIKPAQKKPTATKKKAVPKPKPQSKKMSSLKATPLPKPLTKRPQGKGILCDKAGSFFLKAAEWDLFERSAIGSIVERHISGLSPEEVDKACEILLYSELFGIQELTEIGGYEKAGLWALSDLSSKFSSTKLTTVMESVTDIKSFNIEFSSFCTQFKEEANSLKVFLANSQEFFIDPKFTTIWDSNVQSGFSGTSYKTLALMSKQIVNNLSPLILCSASGEDSLTGAFLNFIAAFENLPGNGITRISLQDKQGSELADFSAIPNKRRTFILGVWPWQEEFTAFEEESRDHPPKTFFHNELGREFYYKEFRSNALNIHLDTPVSSMRGVLLKEAKEGPGNVIIISNMSSQEATAEQIACAYLSRWPNLQRGESVALARSHASGPVEKSQSNLEDNENLALIVPTSLRSNLRKYLDLLNDYVKRHFFPFHFNKFTVNDLMSIVYGLDGVLTKDARNIGIQLQIPAGYLYLEDLELSVKRLNEAEVRDPQGRKLWASIAAKKR